MRAPKIAAVAFAALALVACETETAAPPRDAALSVFRASTADLYTGTSDNLTDAELRDLASDICELAGYADTVDELAIIGIAIADAQTGLSDNDVGRVIGAAIATYCPDEGYRIGLGQ